MAVFLICFLTAGMLNYNNQLQNDIILKEKDAFDEDGKRGDEVLTEQEMEELGDTFLKEKDFDNVIKLFTALHLKYPTKEKYLSMLGYVYLVKEDYEKAYSFLK